MRALLYIQSLILRLKSDDTGAVAAEYAFLIVFIAIIAILGMVLLGPSIADYFEALTRLVPDTSETPPCPLGDC